MDETPHSAKWTMALKYCFISLYLSALLLVLLVLSSPLWIYQVQQYAHREKISSCLNQDWVSHEPPARQPAVSRFCTSYASIHESHARLSDWWIARKIEDTPVVGKNRPERITFGIMKAMFTFFDKIPSWYVESADGIGLAFGIIVRNEIFPNLEKEYMDYLSRIETKPETGFFHKHSQETDSPWKLLQAAKSRNQEKP